MTLCQVPFLQDLVHEDLETPRLVRFRCMVQDTGLGNEVFVRQSRAGKCLMFRDETEDVDVSELYVGSLLLYCAYRSPLSASPSTTASCGSD